MKRLSAAQQRIHQAALRLFAEKGSIEVSVSDLAQAAGVARGTIYNNLENPDHLFEHVAAQLADEMDEQIALTYQGIEDPAVRLSTGIRLYIRRAHEEPHWGRFLVQFGYTNDSLRSLWSGPPMQDLLLGVSTKRYDINEAQVPTAMGMIAGSTLSGILLVLEGLSTWRDAGSQTVVMVLRALGLSLDEAKDIAIRELPSLKALTAQGVIGA